MEHLHLQLSQSHWIPIAIFLVTYFLIAIESGRGSHLDRTAAAFCGAVAMVLVGAVPLAQACQAVDWNTLIFLLGIMILVAHFQIAGFFDWIALRMARIARTRLQLLVVLIFASGILAAFFVNDTICLVFTPIVLMVCDRLELPPIPYLIALATAANIGSVMSVTGNPQNALVGVSAHFTFLEFLAHLAPVSVIGLGLDALILALVFRRQILGHPLAARVPSIEVRLHRTLLLKCGLAALLVIVLWIMGYSFPLVAIAIGAFILVIGRVKAQSVYRLVDWELLLFFASLFVVMRGLQASGAVAALIARFQAGLQAGATSQLFAISGVMLVLSNLVSNVPAVLLMRPIASSLPNSRLAWLAIAGTSTLAGNATPISSVANLIVLQQSAGKVTISFWEFARAGIILTIITTLLAIAVLAAEHHFFPM
ncbi:MAG TPA: SLC13 family permease [Candidatus Acidoferrales bacterium]|nr:SLC13 family permease [Candidatus Acidoferrales bacterium]